MYSLLRSIPEDAAYIAHRARQADIDELWAAAKSTPYASMMRGMENSPEAFTGFIHGEPVCMFGVAALSIMTGDGIPWMVGTDALDRHALPFLRGSREVVGNMLKVWAYLHNWVDARNTKAIRWLKFLGFTVHPAEPHGSLGIPFHPFDMRREPHV